MKNKCKIYKIQSVSFNPKTFGQNLNFSSNVTQREIKPFSIDQNHNPSESNSINCSYYALQNNMYVPYEDGTAFVPL